MQKLLNMETDKINQMGQLLCSYLNLPHLRLNTRVKKYLSWMGGQMDLWSESRFKDCLQQSTTI